MYRRSLCAEKRFSWSGQMRERAGRCTGFNSSWPKLSSLPRRDSSRRSACVPAVHPAPGVVRALPVAVATQTGETGPFVADLGPTPYPRRTVCTGPSPTLVARRYPRFRLTAPPWASIKLNLAAPKRSLRDGHPDPLRCPPPRPPPPGGLLEWRDRPRGGRSPAVLPPSFIHPNGSKTAQFPKPAV